MKTILLGLGSATAGISLLVFVPVLHAILVGVNLVAHACVLGLQLVTTSLSWIRPSTRGLPDEEPFVSIHVPAHNEPPAVLLDTLTSLSRISWKSYEVLVIDNNTTDPALWRPVQELCRTLGPRFRFLHVENLAGFKAGAMNWARQFIDPRTEFLFVVDADYQVEPGCLRRALEHVTDDRIGLVQFPQHYRNITPQNAGIALDFRHFFASYMNMANRLRCVPSTGTLSLISLPALEAVGGFDTAVITEDAEMGFRMSCNGYRAVYVDESIGTGLMPFDLEGLKKQRWRWAFGNAQILKAHWRSLAFGRELTWKQRLGFFSHLTAWFNFNLIPTLSLICLSLVALFGTVSPLQEATLIASAATLVTFLVLRFFTMYSGLRRDGHGLREILQAFYVHLGLGWIFSFSWMKCLWDHRSPFVRTNKFISEAVPGQLRFALVELGVGALLFAACWTMLLTDFVVAPLAALAMAGARFAILWVWKQSDATRRLTERLLAPVREAVLGNASRLPGPGLEKDASRRESLGQGLRPEPVGSLCETAFIEGRSRLTAGRLEPDPGR